LLGEQHKFPARKPKPTCCPKLALSTIICGLNQAGEREVIDPNLYYKAATESLSIGLLVAWIVTAITDSLSDDEGFISNNPVKAMLG
jgi:hypothetical protein